MTKVKTIITSIVVIVQSLIDLARKDPAFAEAIRINVLKAVPKQYKDEADTLLRRILDIRAEVIDYNGIPRSRKYYYRSGPRQRYDGPRK